jgi:hypothetical protein
MGVCTLHCTTEQEYTRTVDLEALAVTLGNLSLADRAKLAALLLGQQAGWAEDS